MTKTLTPEHRAKIGAAQVGNKRGLGYHHTDDFRKKLSLRLIGNTYGVGNRGLSKSAEHRSKLSISKTGKPGHPLSEEGKEKLRNLYIGKKRNWSPGVEQRAAIGRAASITHRGRTPGHIRRIEYNNTIFRSSWEVRFAKALDSKGISWEYEKHRFDLGTCTYTPDFFIPETGAYWEVKGWFNQQSKEKVQRFREMFPETPLIVATKPVLEMMED